MSSADRARLGRAAGKVTGLAVGLAISAITTVAGGVAWLCRRRRARATALLREHPVVELQLANKEANVEGATSI